MNPLWHSTLEACAEAYSIAPDKLTKPRRGDTSASTARFITWYVMHNRDGIGFNKIGRAFGGMDHSTIIHGVRRVGDMMARGDAMVIDLVITEMARIEPTAPKYQRKFTLSMFVAKHKPRNEIVVDDADAFARLRGSDRLIEALRREFPERCAA